MGVCVKMIEQIAADYADQHGLIRVHQRKSAATSSFRNRLRAYFPGAFCSAGACAAAAGLANFASSMGTFCCILST
jgi:hypothetical protein